MTIKESCCLPWLWLSKIISVSLKLDSYHIKCIHIKILKCETIPSIKKFKYCKARFRDFRPFQFTQNFIFRHFLRKVGYCILNWEITIDSRMLILRFKTFPTTCFKISPRRKMCLIYVSDVAIYFWSLQMWMYGIYQMSVSPFFVSTCT